MPENVNVSHPLPIYQDLAIWAATYPFIGSLVFGPRAYICQRAGSSWFIRTSPLPGAFRHEAIVVGYQFMIWYKKKPMPWFKYAMKTNAFMKNCPKVFNKGILCDRLYLVSPYTPSSNIFNQSPTCGRYLDDGTLANDVNSVNDDLAFLIDEFRAKSKAEWGWFFCLKGRFAMKGIDSGMILHRNVLGSDWYYDGLWGIGAFSMNLRADMPVHYFTPIENYDAIEWMCKVYKGKLPYRFLDDRFEDSQNQAPVLKAYNKIEFEYKFGELEMTEYYVKVD